MTPQKKVKSFFGLFERQKSTPIPYSWTILHFSPVTYYKYTADLYKTPKPCPIQGTKKIKWLSIIRGEFF